MLKSSYNVSNRVVSVVCGDACNTKEKGLPPAGTCDIVSISYALVMIPDWKAAVICILIYSQTLHTNARTCARTHAHIHTNIHTYTHTHTFLITN